MKPKAFLDIESQHHAVSDLTRHVPLIDVAACNPCPTDTAPGEELPSTSRTAVMYLLALLFLWLTALVLPHGGVSDHMSELALYNSWIKWAFRLAWLTIIAEAVWGFRAAPDSFKPAVFRLMAVCLIPPFRMMISPAVPNRYIWLPHHGWRHTGKELLEEMERCLTLPMLYITLMVLPVIGAEMFFNAEVEQSPLLATILHVVTAMIWFAFTYEFILMVSIAERKIDFCKAHWINIVIIFLPLVAFLRTLRLFRFLRAAKAGQLMRTYRLRGLTTRARRLALVFNLIERLMQRNPEKYRLHLEEQIRKKEEELAQLKIKLHNVSA